MQMPFIYLDFFFFHFACLKENISSKQEIFLNIIVVSDKKVHQPALVSEIILPQVQFLTFPFVELHEDSPFQKHGCLANRCSSLYRAGYRSVPKTAQESKWLLNSHGHVKGHCPHHQVEKLPLSGASTVQEVQREDMATQDSSYRAWLVEEFQRKQAAVKSQASKQAGNCVYRLPCQNKVSVFHQVLCT